MSDKLAQLLIDALGRAALAPAGLPLVGMKSAPGLFPATAPARQAAQRACADGLIRLVTVEPNGKSERDRYAATDAGLAFLLGQTSPKQVLEDLARAVEGRHGQIDDLLSVARETQTELTAIKAILAKLGEPGAFATGVREFSRNPRIPVANAPSSPSWLDDLRQHLAEWNTAGDCPLPELCRRLQAAHSNLTIGGFHDGLRELHDRDQVYLHPWTGPLYALPEPAFALLVGHEIAYYASQRSDKQLATSEKPDATAARNGAIRSPVLV